MLLRELISRAKTVPRMEVLAIVGSVLHEGKERLLAHPERAVAGHDEKSIRTLLEDRRRGRPLAYITGEREFFSQAFSIDERALIPRPETELVVETALDLREKGLLFSSVLDMGTGSGVLAITLARLLQTDVLALDIDEETIALARHNATRLGASDRVTFVCGDLWTALRPSARFDLIVANLPYVSLDQWDHLLEEVKAFEPRRALVGGTTGLEIYRRFIPGVASHLAAAGRLVCEIGAENQATPLTALLSRYSLDAHTVRDLAGRERVLVASWKSSL